MFTQRQNDFSVRINLMGPSGSGKTGIIAAAFPGMIAVGPNPEGIQITATKVAGYRPDVVRSSQSDPWDAWEQFRLQSWNIVDGDDNPIIANPNMLNVDGESVRLIDDLPYPFWRQEKDGSFAPSYSAVLLDDPDTAMRHKLSAMLIEAGITGDTPTTKEGKEKRNGVYTDYRVYYEECLTNFDELAKNCGINVISSTKVNPSDKDFRGNTIQRQPDFGSGAFTGKSSFLSNLDANYLVDQNPPAASVLDLPPQLKEVAGQFFVQLNCNPSDQSFFIKQRFRYTDGNAPPNLREILAVDGPAFHCPQLASFYWYDELSGAVAKLVDAAYTSKLDEMKKTSGRDAVVWSIWKETTGKFVGLVDKDDVRDEYVNIVGDDPDSLDAIHLTRLAWAFRDGLHRGYLRYRMRKLRREALGR